MKLKGLDGKTRAKLYFPDRAVGASLKPEGR